MSYSAVFAIAVALAMDAFAVALTTGLRLRCVSFQQMFRMSAMFGGWQFAMPVAGWFLGEGAQDYIEAYDHWIAFALLAFVGGRMLREAFQGDDEADKDLSACPDPTYGSSLWLLGIATSIDALAVGLSLAMLRIDVWEPAVIIGAVCFVLTAVGMQVGRVACRMPGIAGLGDKANALGGVVLLAIGFKILYEHGVF